MDQEVLMTTKEYLDKKEKEELDKLFDEAFEENRQRELKELKLKEHKDYMNNLFQKVGDYESEVNILEEIYRTMFESEDCPKEDIDQIKEEIKQAKIRLTKIQNDLEREIFKEKCNL